MVTTKSDEEFWSVEPGDKIKVVKWWSEKLPVGIIGTITGMGKRPNGVNYYNVKWSNNQENYLYDSLLHGHCEKVK